MKESADSDLFRRLAGDDLEAAGDAIAELVEQHKRPVYGMLLRFCNGNWALADEAFQDTFVRFLNWTRERPRVIGPLDAGPLLATFARRAAIDAMRREWRHTATASETEAQNVAAEPSKLQDALQAAELRRLMVTLDERSRQVIELSFFEDLTASEIGRRLKLTPQNVRIVRHRAIGAMRRRLGGAGGTREGEGDL